MKRFVLTCWVAFTLCFYATAQQLTLLETSHDFGIINEEDGDVHYDFQFTNSGNEPLIIKEVITGCGCTSAKWSERPYGPGEKGVIRITYHPERRVMKQFSIPSEIFTNLKEPVTVTVTGKVNLTKHPYYNVFDPLKGEKAKYKEVKIEDDYDLILQRIREQLYQTFTVEAMDKSATSLMKLMSPDGTWPQLDYHCYFRTNWEPLDHVNRIKRMAIAYTCPESSLYGNQVLYRAIDKAARSWNKFKPTSFNWWYNEIAAPKAMADVLALMESGVAKFSPNVKEGWMEMMAASDPRKWTGANKMDIAVHHIVRGCILKNDSIVDTNVKEFFQPVCISKNEGIREDLSYQQHNTQLYIGGYGTVFIDNISKVAPLLVGTKYALSDEKVALFSKFVRNTYLNVFRSRYMDFSVCGRSLTRAKTLDLGDCTALFKKMQKLDPSHAEEYEKVAQRFATNSPMIGRTNKNTYFYLSDYMLHNRKKYDFSVRAVSNRTCRSESGNGENQLGTFVSEGATNIRVSGDEYLDIFPVWEWDKIPGTTAPEGEVENHNDWGVLGKSEFVGGVSDGMYGVMTYAMDDYDIKAKKGWFMFDNEIVCLGTGIEGEVDKAINTSVNQCHLVGDVYVSVDGNLSKFAANSQVETNLKGWLWHNKIGYYFPDSTAVMVKNGNQSGRWSRINFNQSGEMVTLPVFNVWIQHGMKPNKGAYAYYILPGVASPASLKYYNPEGVKVLSNTEKLQAVQHVKLDILQAIFYEAGELQVEDKTLTVKKPCVVMIKGVKSECPKVLLADPTQKENFLVGREVIFEK